MEETKLIQGEKNKSFKNLVINFLREIRKAFTKHEYVPTTKDQSKILEKLQYENRNLKRNPAED